VVEQLSADLRDARMSIVLSDARGHVVDRRIVDERLRSRLDRVSLAPGFIYAEAVVGTNAIGTALVTRKAVAVEGDEHYVEALTAMAGAAAPIADPRSGHVLGVIDLTCCAEDASVLLLSFARRAARDVEQRLVDDVGLPEGVVLQRSLRDRRPPMSDGCWNSPPRDGGRPAEPWGRLNGTEGRVAELVSRGLTNREVAGRLFMSQHTVGYHLRSIFRKFGVSSRVDLTRVALEARQAGPALVYRASRNVTTASTRRWSSSSS
jgi:DNA-binding CsgD family transcriptional regulator